MRVYFWQEGPLVDSANRLMALSFAGVALFVVVWQVVHGQPVDRLLVAELAGAAIGTKQVGRYLEDKSPNA